MADNNRIYRILVIDDERTLHAMLQTVLGSHGFDVVSAFNGEEGLALARAGNIDLILLDVIMPGMKGREVCRTLKNDPATKDIPVVFLTAKDSSEDVAAELQAGAIGHITKPVNSMLLVGKIKHALGA